MRPPFILCFCCLATILFSNSVFAQRNATQKFDPADSTRGLVIYSISTTKPVFRHYYIEILNIEDGRKERLFLSGFASADVKNDTCKVHYYATLLPSGAYEISGWGLLLNSNIGTRNLFLGGNFRFPFTVSGGQINYLGDYLGVAIRNRDMIGLKNVTGGYFVASNRLEQDYEVIEHKWPDLHLSKVLNALPDFSENKAKRSLVFLKGIDIP